MSSTVFDQIKLLYDLELYSNVVTLADMVLSISNHCPDMLTSSQKFLTYNYYGDSLFHMDQYKRAEAIYRQGMQFRKSVIIKSKQTTAKLRSDESTKDLMPDMEMKYNVHLCHVKLNQFDKAINILQSIPAKQRTAKVNMALAKLYQDGGLERSAAYAFKEVLRECPLALLAAEGLLALGVSGIEVNSLIIDVNLLGMDWLNCWIKAHAHLQNREYALAIASFLHLELRTPLRGNHLLTVCLGEAYYYNGDHKNSLATLQRAYAIDSNMVRGFDVLARLLAEDKRISELERLMPENWIPEDNPPEIWTALSYLFYAQDNVLRAVYLAQKACLVSPRTRNIEALILKGNLLYDLQKYQEAVAHFREVFQFAPHRFEPHQGLVNCYIAMHRLREAVTIASNACKQLSNAPRALTMYASVLMKDPVTVGKAKTLLEKALSGDESYLPAVYMLAEIYEQEMNLGMAVKLLDSKVEIHPTSKIHQMLGNLYTKLKNNSKAFDHFHTSLNLDPNNRRALEGMHRLDGPSSPVVSASGRTDTTFYNNLSDVDNVNNSFEPHQDNNRDSDSEFTDFSL